MKNQSTRQLIPVADIRDDVVIMKNGSLRALLEITALNFELRSEDEQNAIVGNFQNFLNSIDFPLQIVVNSRRLDINQYLETISRAGEELQNELLKIQAIEYGKFIQEISGLANIMDKTFYVVVPFYGVALPSASGILENITGLFGKKSPKQEFNEQQFLSNRNQLMQRVELVMDGLVGMGLKAKVVTSEEAVQVFYTLYNPSSETSEPKDSLNSKI